jgi:hypothetical protein
VKVHVSGRVDDVQAMVIPETGGRSRLNGDTALLLLLHEVRGRGAIVYLTGLMDLAGELEDALGRGGFTGIDVRERYRYFGKEIGQTWFNSSNWCSFNTSAPPPETGSLYPLKTKCYAYLRSAARQPGGHSPGHTGCRLLKDAREGITAACGRLARVAQLGICHSSLADADHPRSGAPNVALGQGAAGSPTPSLIQPKPRSLRCAKGPARNRVRRIEAISSPSPAHPV